jgi:inosine kinase
VGPKGLYIASYVDDAFKRETKDHIFSKSIPEYNKYEYSRSMLKADCERPIKMFTHINPYMGGPMVIKNTNGAGDAALAALLHDIASNTFHRKAMPNSPKHNAKFLTYSSIHQVSKYCNRVSYEVLRQNSPRILKGLPNREESLEDAYWDM